MMFKSTFRRKDGRTVWVDEELIDNTDLTGVDFSCVKTPPFDVVQEKWVKVAERVIRLGAEKECDNPDCKNGRNEKAFLRDEALQGNFADPKSPAYRCKSCKGLSEKPRYINPPWIQVK